MTTTIPTWKDAAEPSREWTCIINVAKIRAARELTGVDLLNALDGELLRSITEDPVKLSDIMWAVSKTQADDKQVTKESFEEAFTGDAIESAGDALIEALINFFQSSRRDVLRRAWKKTRDAQSEVMTMAGQKLDSEAMSGAITRLMAQASNEIDQQLNELGKPSTS